MKRGNRRSRRSGGERRRSSRSPDFLSIVDPGSSCLRFLVVEATHEQATIWGWDDVPGWAGIDAQRLHVICEEMLSRAEAMAHDRSPLRFLSDQMLVGLPASQLRGRSWSITQRRSQPGHPVEERELEALLGRALRLAVNRLRSEAPLSDAVGQGEHVAAHPRGSDWLLVDATPVALTVDGRRVTDPVGFRAQEIGATVFAAMTRGDTVETWRTVAQGLEFLALTVTATPLALARGLSEFQGVLLDVGGESTDLTLWQAGQPVALDSVPVGGAALTRSLIRAWNLSLDQAERLKRAYASGYLTEGERAQVLEVMFPALRAWLEETETALARLSMDGSLPQQIYLLGGGSALPEMVEAARALAWSERLHFVRYPQVGRLRSTDVPGVVNRTDSGKGTGDVSALALAAWAARQNQPVGRPARILGELCRA